MKHIACFAASALLCLSPTTSGASDPWADEVVQFEIGIDGAAGFGDPASALGSPTRFTSPDSNFGGPVTPFNAPFGANELFSIGEGGSLTVRFEEPVTDDPLNPFGVDLLVFGNAFMGLDFAAGTANGGIGSEGGRIEVSRDGITFFEAPGVDADGLFPTLGFSDVDVPFPATAAIPSDFTRPVNPSLKIEDFAGLTMGQIAALYDGSGGGAAIDLSVVGLAEVAFVRISNPIGSGVTPEIDGFADVRAIPEPNAGSLLLLSALLWGIRGNNP